METASVILLDYSNTPIGSITPHKFVNCVRGDNDFKALSATSEDNNKCRYGLKVYVNNFMSIVIPTSRDQLEHIATAIMTGIHDVFPANITDSEDLIMEKKLLKGEGQHSLIKTLLGFEFD
jgi:hypothetical protein